jgi:hypothetical protein
MRLFFEVLKIPGVLPQIVRAIRKILFGDLEAYKPGERQRQSEN